MGSAKEYLQKIKYYDNRIDAGLEELSRLEELVTRITPVLKQDVVSSSGSQDKLGDTVAEIADLRTKINRDTDAFIDLKREALVLLAKVKNPTYYAILHKRHFEYKKWEQIAVEMNYGYRNVTKLHGRALQAFEKVLHEEHQTEAKRKGEG